MVGELHRFRVLTHGVSIGDSLIQDSFTLVNILSSYSVYRCAIDVNNIVS